MGLGLTVRLEFNALGQDSIRNQKQFIGDVTSETQRQGRSLHDDVLCKGKNRSRNAKERFMHAYGRPFIRTLNYTYYLLFQLSRNSNGSET